MNKIKSFLIAGGDVRQLHLAKRLAKNERFKVYVFMLGEGEDADGGFLKVNYLEKMDKVDYLVLPMIFSTDGVYLNSPLDENKIELNELFKTLKSEGTVLGGKIDASLFKLLKSKGFKVIDYSECDELMIKNSVPTAEGTLKIALVERDETLLGSKVLIMGFGRVGKACAKAFLSLGSKVTVMARKSSDLAYAKTSGCETVSLYDKEAPFSDYDIVINTVPSLIFDEEKLSKLKGDCLIIDLASKPGGVDFEEAKRLGIKTIWASGIPGKEFPVTAGEIIYEAILNILRERGDDI